MPVVGISATLSPCISARNHCLAPSGGAAASHAHPCPVLITPGYCWLISQGSKSTFFLGGNLFQVFAQRRHKLGKYPIFAYLGVGQQYPLVFLMARSEGYLGSKIDQKTHPRNQNQVHRAATSFLVGEPWASGRCARGSKIREGKTSLFLDVVGIKVTKAKRKESGPFKTYNRTIRFEFFCGEVGR